MPELPEVETVKLGLKRLIIGKTIIDAISDNFKSFPNEPNLIKKYLINSKISNVRRRAKVLMIDLSSGFTLVIHLKMTGQMVYRGDESFGAGHPTDSLIGQLPDRSTRVTLIFSDQSKLFFNDQRKFGWMKLIATVEVENIDFMRKVGPEPLSVEFSVKLFNERLQKRPNTLIKAALLDQTVLAGIGNIYADESLWGAKIHPGMRVKQLSKSSIKKLHEEIIYVLKLAIEKGGSTDRNYVNAEGKKGTYMQFARVFRREKLPCPRCHTTIEKIRMAGRGTHFCPKCQKLNLKKLS